MATVGPTAGSYVRAQASIAGMINLVVNPAIDWLTTRHSPPQPVWGLEGLVVNFVITSLILATLVGAFAAWGVRREMRAGRIKVEGTPRRGWAMGLALGAASATAVVAASGVLHTTGVTTLSLVPLIVVKGIYSGALAYWVTQRVVRRSLR